MISTILYTTITVATLTAIVLWLVRKSKESIDEYDNMTQEITYIRSISFEKAKSLAMRYIQDERMFRCISDPMEANFPLELPRSVYELLQRFSQEHAGLV